MHLIGSYNLAAKKVNRYLLRICFSFLILCLFCVFFETLAIIEQEKSTPFSRIPFGASALLAAFGKAPQSLFGGGSRRAFRTAQLITLEGRNTQRKEFQHGQLWHSHTRTVKHGNGATLRFFPRANRGMSPAEPAFFLIPCALIPPVEEQPPHSQHAEDEK